MKKIIIFITVIIFLCFLIPIIFTQKFETVQMFSENKKIEELQVDKSYNYNDYTTIKLLHANQNHIEDVNLDEYLCNVVSAEIPASYNQEALKAQAVVARTYTIYTIIRNAGKHGEANICDSPNCCQAWISKEDRLAKWSEEVRVEYWNKIVEAVNSTIGEIVTYNGEIINALYHANSGGKTEIASGVWSGGDYPYLQSVETAGEEGYEQYSSEVNLTYTELAKKMKSKYSNFEFGAERTIQILEYMESGRVKTIQIGNINLSGVELRTLLGLKSANFQITTQEENINIKVTGYGHGVGMSQTGADALANQGYTYNEIIQHFYTGVEIVNINKN